MSCRSMTLVCRLARNEGDTHQGSRGTLCSCQRQTVWFAALRPGPETSAVPGMPRRCPPRWHSPSERRRSCPPQPSTPGAGAHARQRQRLQQPWCCTAPAWAWLCCWTCTTAAGLPQPLREPTHLADLEAGSMGPLAPRDHSHSADPRVCDCCCCVHEGKAWEWPPFPSPEIDCLSSRQAGLSASPLTAHKSQSDTQGWLEHADGCKAERRQQNKTHHSGWLLGSKHAQLPPLQHHTPDQLKGAPQSTLTTLKCCSCRLGFTGNI